MSNFKNILMINYGGIGDEILFLPAIKGIKEQYSEAKITLALEGRAKSVKDLTNLVDEIIEVDIKTSFFKKIKNILQLILKARKSRFDCVISSGKSPLVAIILFLTGIKERLGYKTKTSFLLTKSVELNENQYAGNMYFDLIKSISNSSFKLPQIDINSDFELDKNFNRGQYICIHPGVSKMSIQKNIFKTPKADFWTDLISGLLEKNRQVVLFGTKDDKDIVDEILKNEKISNHKNFFNYFQKTKSILEMAYIMKNAFCVICADSAPLHVALGVGAKIFAIFAPTNEKKLVPDIQNVTVIKNDIPCRPCLWHKRQFNCENSDCLLINPKMILDKIN